MAPCSDSCTLPYSGRVNHRRTQPILRPPRKPSNAVADHGTGINDVLVYFPFAYLIFGTCREVEITIYLNLTSTMEMEGMETKDGGLAYLNLLEITGLKQMGLRVGQFDMVVGMVVLRLDTLNSSDSKYWQVDICI
ncbi:hypothetical protein U1Q18_049930 [Sarracenia purpurea var. burkii]